jgi:hypothetical protein
MENGAWVRFREVAECVPATGWKLRFFSYTANGLDLDLCVLEKNIHKLQPR